MKIKRFLAIVLVFVITFFGSKAILDFLDARSGGDSFAKDPSFEDNALDVSKNEHLILLVGVDKNSAEVVDEDFTRTDTIMLLKANTEDGTIKLLSIPRDTRIQIRDNFDKVNHAHAFGGIDLTMKTLRKFLGLDIDYYVQVNYQAVINIVDALGGLDYEVPEGIKIDRGSIKIRPGLNHFNGWETLWYLRTRKIYNNGDIGRVGTQQAFVKAMVDQMKKKSKDINFITFITNYLRYVKTNLNADVIVDLVKNIDKFSSDKVKTYTVPGREAMLHGISYYIPDYEGTWDIVDEAFSEFKLSKWTKEDSGYLDYDKAQSAPLAPKQIPNPQPSYNKAPTTNNNYYEDNNYYENSYDSSYQNNNYYEEKTYEQPSQVHEKVEPAPKESPKTEEMTHEEQAPSQVENGSAHKVAPPSTEDVINYEPSPLGNEAEGAND